MDPTTETTTAPVDPMAALDAGIAGEPMPSGEPVEASLPDVPVTEPADLANPTETPEVDALGEPVTPPGDQAPPNPAETAKGDAPPPADQDPAADVETEITALGMKGKTADRFRDLSAKVAAAEPLRAELEAVGVTSVEELRGLVADADRGVAIFDEVRKTGATPEEYAEVLTLLQDRAEFRAKRDPAIAQRVLDTILEEAGRIATVLGVDLRAQLAGKFDPLAGHPDLQEQVEALEITQAAAVELAQARNLRAHAATVQQAQATTTAAQTAQQQAFEAAKATFTALGQALAGEDAARFEHYKGNGQMAALVAQIKQQFPDRPDVWADKFEVAYRRLPALAPPAPVTPPPSPARPAAPLPPTMALDFAKMTPAQALDAALEGL